MFYHLIYHVFRYRRSVVVENLTNSFPEKSDEEIGQIARKFYHFICDSLVETFYYDRISEEEIKKRVTVLNIGLVEKYLDEGRTVVVVFAHYNNWEWNSSLSLHTKYPANVVYKKLTNKTFDRFYYNLRAKFGIIPIERADILRQLIADLRDKKSSATAFIMDQTPRKHEIQYWTTFLNQDTPVLTGTEKIARKIDAAVFFCHVRKLKKGYNRLEFSLIVEHAKNTAPYEITEKSTRMIEEMIIERPELWLLSHKRWKHKREV
jgi:KDO2-lipid IV(A) lauroyltransferase